MPCLGALYRTPGAVRRSATTSDQLGAGLNTVHRFGPLIFPSSRTGERPIGTRVHQAAAPPTGKTARIPPEYLAKHDNDDVADQFAPQHRRDQTAACPAPRAELTTHATPAT